MTAVAHPSSIPLPTMLLLYASARELASIVPRLPSGHHRLVTGPLDLESLWLHEPAPDAVLLAGPAEREELVRLCRTVREKTDLPLIVLASFVDEATIARCLATGVDEYLALSLGDIELRARIEAVLRRAGRQGTLQGVRYAGDLTLDMRDYTVDCAGRRIVLSPIEFRLLACLASSPGKVFTHETLMSRVWGAEYVDARHYLYLYIRYLREKLEDDPNRPARIVSEWGVGYRLVAAAGAAILASA